LCCGLAFLLGRGRVARYVAGERTEGLTDALARTTPVQHRDVRFTDVTESAGIHFLHAPFTRTNRLPEDMGSGVALGDIDGDGWTDVFLVNTAHSLEPGAARASDAGGRCALYRNRGDGTFEDVSRASHVDLEVVGMGAAFFDYDSDGDLDLLVTTYGGLVLLRNDGHGRFEDVTRSAGLADRDGFWTGIAVGDYDRDGFVDLYVCGYVRWSDEVGDAGRLAKQFGVDIAPRINPSAFPPEKNLLFHNRGDGTFEEVGEKLGVSNPTGRSLSATFADLTGDGWPDIYVANDISDNAFFVNKGDGTFVDMSAQALVADYRGAMGLAVGDFDNDLDLDFEVTHWIGQENALYVNFGKPKDAEHPFGAPMFMDSADRFGLGSTTLDRVGWATRFFDFDNDGWLDLFVVNGSTIPTSEDKTKLGAQKSQLFWNAGATRGFFEVGATSGDFFGEEHVGRGGATFDFDLDGDEDLLITVRGEGPRLLRNDGGNANHSLRVRLREPSGNRFALGARIEIDCAGRRAMDELDTQGSYLSQHAVGELSFGLGAAERVDLLKVTWPGGASDEARDLAADSLVTWVRGSPPVIERLPGKRAAPPAPPKSVDDQRRFYALIDRAALERLSGDFERASGTYRGALELWPGHADCLYYLGNCRLELGRADEARSIFEDLVLRYPRESRGWMQLGSIFLARGERTIADLDRAELAFEKSRAINSEESLPVVRLGVVAMLRGDLDRADKLLADAAALNSQSVEARYFRARIAWLRKDTARATALLEEARAIAAKRVAAAQATLHEGGTKSGAAMTATTPTAADSLKRWMSVLDRPLDPEAEFSGENR
jgi:Flp pilus assembly protein TadD